MKVSKLLSILYNRKSDVIVKVRKLDPEYSPEDLEVEDLVFEEKQTERKIMKPLKIEIEVTPEIEEVMNKSWVLNSEHFEAMKDTLADFDKVMAPVKDAYLKAKKQPKIKPNIWDCTQQPVTNDIAMNDKINEIIEWVNNHD